MSDRPWCKDVARDEAVRAAEDAAERPAVPDWRDIPDRVAALEREVAAMRAPVEAEAEVERLRAENAGLRNRWRLSIEANYKRAAERDAAIRERDAALARVAELEAAAKLAPAPNVGGGSNQADAEPVAWRVTADDPPPVGQMVLGRWDLLICGNRTVSYGEVVNTSPFPNVWWRAASRSERIPPTQWRPLPPGPSEGREEWEAEPAAGRSPPPPREWLTADEKAAIRWAMSEGLDEDVFSNLLARNSPPKVRLPSAVHKDILAALAAAGVEVEE